MRRILVFIILLNGFLSLNKSFAQNNSQTIFSNEFSEKVDSIVINIMNRYHIPGLSIGLVKGDSKLYTKGYGITDIENPRNASENSVFHTASISKLFTALAIMQLVEKQMISLETKIVDEIPELKYKEDRVKNITIKHLLNHTSGLQDIKNYHWKNSHQNDNSLRDFIIKTRLKVLSEPSKEYHYSNLGYNILGYLIEKLTADTFENYIKENILIPSGMNNSDFRYFRIADTLKVSPHSKRWISQKVYVRDTYPYTREHSPSSTLNASAKDLSQWMIFFLKRLKDNDLQGVFSDMLKASNKDFPFIGLGFQLYDFKEFQAVGHYGGDKGFRSFLIMIPKEEIGLVVLGNADYEENYRQEILIPIVKLMLTKN